MGTTPKTNGELEEKLRESLLLSLRKQLTNTASDEIAPNGLSEPFSVVDKTRLKGFYRSRKVQSSTSLSVQIKPTLQEGELKSSLLSQLTKFSSKLADDKKMNTELTDSLRGQLAAFLSQGESQQPGGADGGGGAEGDVGKGAHLNV